MSNLNVSERPAGPETTDRSEGAAAGRQSALRHRELGDHADEARAIAAAVQVFEDGLMRLAVGATGARPSQLAADEATGLLAGIAGQTSLMALRAAIEAARDGGEGRSFAAAAAEVRDLAGQMARATETIVAQVGLIQAAAERAQGASVREHRRAEQISAA